MSNSLHIEASRSSGSDAAAGELALRTKPADRKKTLGIFYTPVDLSRCLSDWAIETPDDCVLEPSFGGCGFLESCATALKARGAAHAWRQLCGCDKHARAFGYLPARFRTRAGNRRFLHRNFLETTPADYCIHGFSAVVGNPPYVSRHNMLKYQKASAERLLAGQTRFPIPRRASLWAYFIVHSLQFLRAGARMAWVLPRSLSQSDYGRELVASLCGSFEAIGIVSLQHRYFTVGGADEVTDILIGRGFRPKSGMPCTPMISYAKALAELKTKLDLSKSGCALPVALSSAREELLTIEELRAFSKFGEVVGHRALGEIADIKIGIVTGATRFFVLKQSELASRGLTVECCKPLLTSSTSVKGLAWTSADQASAIAGDERILLVRHDHPATKGYWARFPEKKRAEVATFGKRPLWNDPDDGKHPAAFCFSLVHDGPRLVANSAEINSNNSVYRIYFKEKLTSTDIRLAALLMMSSYVQLSGELTGRVCGAGGLKFEPSDAARIHILRTPADWPQRLAELWSRVDLLLRNGAEREAMAAVDGALLQSFPRQLDGETVILIQQALGKLRDARRLSNHSLPK